MALSGKITVAIAFLSGVIFSNGVGAFFQGEFFMSFLSFLTIMIVALIKRFVDWDVEQ